MVFSPQQNGVPFMKTRTQNGLYSFKKKKKKNGKIRPKKAVSNNSELLLHAFSFHVKEKKANEN